MDASWRSALANWKFGGQVLPNVRKVVYNIDIKRVMRSKLVLGIADGWFHRWRDYLSREGFEGRVVQTRLGAGLSGTLFAAGHHTQKNITAGKRR